MNNKGQKNRDTYFYKAVLSLQDEQECRDFFEDICAMGEMKTIIQRFEVARMLKEKKVYTEIMQEINTSSATISRVNRMINYGTGCLGKVLDRVLNKENGSE